MSRYYTAIPGDGTIAGWAAGTNRFWEYATGTCAQAEVAFQALADSLYAQGRAAGLLSYTTATLPTIGLDDVRVNRNCSVSVSGSITSVSVAESNGQTIITVTGTVSSEFSIKATGGNAQWGDTLWYETTNGKYVWQFLFQSPGTYRIYAREKGNTDESKYVYVDLTRGGASVTPAPTPVNDPVVVQDVFVVSVPAGNPEFLTVVRRPYNGPTGFWGITVSSPASPNDLGFPNRVWRYMLGGGVWITLDQVNAALLEPKVPYALVAACVDPNVDESQWRNQPTPVTQTTIYLK